MWGFLHGFIPMPERPAEHVVTTHRRLWPSRSRIGLRNGQAGFGHTKFSGGFGRFSLPVALRRHGTWAMVGGGGLLTALPSPTCDERVNATSTNLCRIPAKGATS